MQMNPAPIRNAMTVDVEDYFQVSAFAPYIPREAWPSISCRVESNIDRILALLDNGNTKATFFTLGWIAERYPAMVRRIVANGHELASHGWAHHRVTDQAPHEFRDDITRAKALLEDIGGQPVLGYRAPSFSIGRQNQWALGVLEESGYRYSSSIYPRSTRPLRHARCAPLRLLSAQQRRAAGVADHHDAVVQSKYSRWRRRLFQALALSGLPMVSTKA